VKKVPLTWLPNPENDMAYYDVYRNSDGGRTFSPVMKTGGRASYVDKGLEDWQESLRKEDFTQLETKYGI
jgi:hypothetical protein